MEKLFEEVTEEKGTKTFNEETFIQLYQVFLSLETPKSDIKYVTESNNDYNEQDNLPNYTNSCDAREVDILQGGNNVSEQWNKILINTT